ncbi:MAG: insulinase family protein, partial [Lachnospiraceae bacterium]
EDNNKVFNICFRTPPKDSTGVAHITEHSVLCGSKEFPLKDPFVELAKGSLNTFLNALTYPDKTMYPVASTNDADFRNLMHVYLDAVFYPNTYREPRIFRQEGWSYEMESPEDALKINGVVYNEMKGVYSSPDEYLDHVRLVSLFPDSIYGVESGGDPAAIPDLTYEEFLAFHSRYYHPSNSYITIYGDMDMEDTLRFLDEKYFSNFEKIEVDSAIGRQAAFDKTNVVRDEYPLAADEDPSGRSYLSWSVVCGDIFDKKQMLALKMLNYALLQIPGAPIKQAILDSGICEDVDGGLDDSICQPYFAVTAKNADENAAERFVSIIRDTLAGIVEKGIDQKAILAGLNSSEFRFREADFLVFPKGLFYSLDTFSTWLYDDARPFDALEILDVYEELRKEVGTGYFERLIREKFLDNPFSSLVILTGKPGLQEARDAKMALAMEKKKAALSTEEIDAIVASTRDLREFQRAADSEENVRKLPLLTREDLGHESKKQSNIERRVGDTKILWHDVKCNGIVYTKLYWDTKKVPQELLPELSFLTAVLLSVNTENYSYNALSSAVDSVAGGMSFSIYEAKKNYESGYRPYFVLSFKMFERNAAACFALAKEVVRTSVMRDEKRLRELIASERIEAQNALQAAGNATAARRALAGVSAISAYEDSIQGIEYYRAIKDYHENFEEKKGQLMERLELLMQAIFDPENLLVSVTADASGLSAVMEALPCMQEGFPVSPFRDSPEVEVSPFGAKREAFTTPGQVQYVALAGLFENPAERYKGSMQILRTVLSLGYLWEEIRVTGGAYGCGGYLTRNGGAVLSSFRDPHLARTVKVFEGVPEHIAAFDADEREMTKYIIGTISSIDTPLTPFLSGEFSMSMYFSGVTDEENYRLREEVLAATPEDIRNAAACFAEAQKTGGI